MLQNVVGAGVAPGARAAAAVRRAVRVGDADRRAGDRAGLRAAVRAGRRAGAAARSPWPPPWWASSAGGLIGGTDRHAADRAAAPRARAGDPRAGATADGRPGRRGAAAGPPPDEVPVGRGRRVATCCSRASCVILVAMWAGSWVSARHHGPGRDAAGLHRRHARGRRDAQPGRPHRLAGPVAARPSTTSATWPCRSFWCMALMTLELWKLAGRGAAAARRSWWCRWRWSRSYCCLADLPRDGPRLRCRGDGGRLLRLHDGHDGERHGQHGRPGPTATARRRGRSWSCRWSARSSSTSPTPFSSRRVSTCSSEMEDISKRLDHSFLTADGTPAGY